MEGVPGLSDFCGIHGAELSGFASAYLSSLQTALERRWESGPLLRAILAATDRCPECRRKLDPRSPRFTLAVRPPAEDPSPEGFVSALCVRASDGSWSCTFDAGVKRKILLLGDASAKKDELLRTAVHDEVPDLTRDILGAKVLSRHETVRDPDEGLDFHVTFTVWDVLGHRIADKRRLRAFFRGAKTVLAACDLSEERSVHELGYWLGVSERLLGKVPAVIVATRRTAPDPSGIAEARLAEIARAHHAAVVHIPPADAHAAAHLFAALGEETIRDVFGTRWRPSPYR